MYKIIHILIVFILSLSLFSSCKKKSGADSPTIFTIDKGAALFSYQTSIKDTLIVTRDKSSAYFRVSANTKDMNAAISRLYIFKRNLDNPSSPSTYTSIEGNGYIKDSHNNYYYKIATDTATSSTNDLSVALRSFDTNAIEDEYFFVYTSDADFSDPSSTDGVVIGPIQLFVKYGKLIEHKGVKLYNHTTSLANAYSGFDINNLVYKLQTDAAADMDISEMTSDTQLFLGKFKSLNNTTFVKAPAAFSYANATDTEVSKYYSLGTPFTETPDSIRVGDVYLIKIRELATSFAAMKIMYVQAENGKVGVGNNKEYFIFNLKK